MNLFRNLFFELLQGLLQLVTLQLGLQGTLHFLFEFFQLRAGDRFVIDHRVDFLDDFGKGEAQANCQENGRGQKNFSFHLGLLRNPILYR